MVAAKPGGYRAVHIYVEGGGPHRGDQAPLREAFTKLFGDVLGDLPKPRVIACGGRSNAFRDFTVALRSNKDTLCLLLVDSEGPIAPGASVWAHVHERRGDVWERPAAVEEDQLHFMVQMMEAWIVADVDEVSLYYGKGFDTNALASERIEDISKENLEMKLAKATRLTSRKEYKKSDGFVLIGRVDAKRVERACPYAQRFFKYLRRVCAELPRPRGARGPGA